MKLILHFYQNAVVYTVALSWLSIPLFYLASYWLLKYQFGVFKVEEEVAEKAEPLVTQSAPVEIKEVVSHAASG